MKRHALFALPFVVCLVMFALAPVSSAKDESGMPSGSPIMKSPFSESSEQSREVKGQWHHRPSLQAIMEKLGITDEQKTKIRALRVGFLDRTRKTRMDLRTIRDEKKTMLLSGKIDQQKLVQMDDQVVKLVSDLLKETLKLRRDRLALMTPEQIGRIADWKTQKAFRSKWRRTHYFGGWSGHFVG